MSDTLPPLLLGLFRELKAHGVPVGVRDYLDGVEALRLGFGQDSRAALRDLAVALWGRSDEERRLISRWFDVLPAPDPALADAIEASLSGLSTPDARVGHRDAPTPDTPGGQGPTSGGASRPAATAPEARSEERRVGKERRPRWSP